MKTELKLEEGWSTPILLTLVLLNLVWAIETTRWVPGLEGLQWVALGAIIFGFLCAKSRISALIAFTYSLVTGPVWIFLLFGSAPRDVLKWQKQFWHLVDRITAWGRVVMAGGRGADNLIFVLQLALIVWFTASISVWLVLRYHKVWHVLLFIGTMLLLVLYNAPQSSAIGASLFIFLLSAMLLVIRVYVHQQTQTWQEAHIQYDRDISLDFLSQGALFSAALLVTAWLTPLPSSYPEAARIWAYLEEPWGEVQAEISRLFSTVRYEGRARGATYNDKLTLGGPRDLSAKEMMKVYAAEGRYWRSMTYEEYHEGTWKTDSRLLKWAANTNLWETEYQFRHELTQTFEILAPQGRQLFAASHPLRVDQEFKVAAIYLPDDPDTPVTFSGLHSRRALKPDQTYTVVSSVSNAYATALRAGRGAYPRWILELYTQVSETLPQRVRDLSDEITAPYNNPYDKVVALETYLRDIKYNEQIPAPPPDRDAVDYFLFERREGYCNYYASALALMARVQGIPARIVTGYSRGEFDPDNGFYLVRERNAHSWVEVYFPQYGWIEFEPTASETRFGRQSPAELANAPEAGEGTSQSSQERPEDSRRNIPEDELLAEDAGSLPEDSKWEQAWGWWIAGIGGGILLLANVILWTWWWAELRHLSRMGQIYAQLCRYGRWLGIGYKIYQTPREYATALAAALPANRGEIQRITALYLRDSFSPRQPTPRELTEIQAVWKELQRALQWQLLRKAARLS